MTTDGRHKAAEAAKAALRAVSRLTARLLVMPRLCYQHFITPYTPPACRFTPTCSEYARQALPTHGPLKGVLLAM